SALRLPAVVMVIAAMSSTLGSAAPAQPQRTVETTLLAASMPVDQVDPRPQRIPQATPSAGPSLASPLPTAVARPVPTPRPIPAPAIDAQEVALVNLDTGRFLWQ